MYIYLGCQMKFAAAASSSSSIFCFCLTWMKWNKIEYKIKWCEIKYEMQMSCIELKSIESAFVEDDNNVEKISKRNHM
jgi:hypothetical protein